MSQIVDRYPLSPMQMGMLFRHLAAQAHEPGVDLEQIVCTLKEEVDAGAMRAAWQRVVERHAVFRTSFRWEGIEEPMQEVWSAASVPWEELDWRGWAGADRQARLDAWLEDDRARGLRPDAAPVMRLTLIRFGSADCILVWTFHHLLIDGRSFPIILKEALGSYDADLTGRPAALPRPPRPYRDFVQWARQRDLTASERFWRDALRGFTAATPLPGALPGAPPLPASPSGPPGMHRGTAMQEAALSAEATARLRTLAELHQLTLNSFVQGAWAVLLARYCGEDDVVFGATRACRRSSVDGADEMVGVFINTLPVRAKIEPDVSVLDWLRRLRTEQREVWAHEHTPLAQVQAWSEVPHGTPLFETLVVFDNYYLETALRSQGGRWKTRGFRLHERTGYPLTLYGYAEPQLRLALAYDRARIEEGAARRMVGHLLTLLEAMAAGLDQPVDGLSILPETEKALLLSDWNATATPDRVGGVGQPIHDLFEAQAARTPQAIALRVGETALTYGELEGRARRLADGLRAAGVGVNTPVGVCVDEPADMLVGIAAVHRCGASVVPLDPDPTGARPAFLRGDVPLPIVLTREEMLGNLWVRGEHVRALGEGWVAVLTSAPPEAAPARPRPENLAYVIYTSGSTGKPKGVMIEHRNVVNFFTGMDQRIPRDSSTSQETWLAVTSLSFDISVLELLWTLARGFKVVVHSDQARRAASGAAAVPAAPMRRVDFSLYYFASGEGGGQALEKYRLLLDGARFADRHGFEAVWTPERHFHAFGGLYPNPSVASAALASITSRVKIRAGSVVLPLHHPARVAEEWALVDNLSNGRVGISFASGWQPVDFVLSPQSYKARQELMYHGIEIVRRLWRGEAVAFPNVSGEMSEIRTLPRPVQPELPVWVTTAGSIDTWKSAGRIGAHVLTHLLGQTVEEVADKVRAYREARAQAGHDPEAGIVTMMLHTFVGDDTDEVKEIVRKPMTDYLASSLSLVKNVASSWAAFKRRADGTAAVGDLDLKSLSREEMNDLLAFSFERYFETSGLFGTPENCLAMVEALAGIGVSEIACLIDFGVDADTALAHLDLLNRVREMATSRAATPQAAAAGNGSIGTLIRRHGVTHMQCTPSMAGMILMNDDDRAALGSLKAMMIGGEAFPTPLAEELFKASSAAITNMYGPTETTVWSSTQVVQRGEAITIGRPIANTQLYILDKRQRPVPIGVVGELYIGGDGVVRGYLNRPELTAERFIPDPFSREPGARLYRTGDLARYLPDGRVEFLGRGDQQVKIRGYRIELGEIEAEISRWPEVREVVVLAREDSPGDKRLVAYLVAHTGEEIAIGDLRASLRSTLPEFMVPSHFVVLKAMPLTPNNKIDRKALPAPETVEAPAPAAAAVAGPPATQIEQTIARIWQEVLGIRHAGVNDNFFDLGGHSLLAVKAHRRLKEAFKRDLAITDLFRFPTVRSLARFLGDSGDGRDSALQASEDRGAARREMAQRLRRTQRNR